MARVRLGFGLWVGFRARARLCLGLELISLAERTLCQVNLLGRGFSADGMGRSRGQKAYYVIVCALQILHKLYVYPTGATFMQLLRFYIEAYAPASEVSWSKNDHFCGPNGTLALVSVEGINPIPALGSVGVMKVPLSNKISPSSIGVSGNTVYDKIPLPGIGVSGSNKIYPPGIGINRSNKCPRALRTVE